MKKLLVGLIGCAMLASSALAQITLSDSTAATTIKRAITQSAAFYSFQVTDTSGSANRIYLRDNSSASSTNIVLPSYTYYVSYPTNLVSSYTNLNGVAMSVTNSVLYTYESTVAASTNAARLVNMISIPANGTVTWTPPSAQGVTFGLQLYSVGTANYTLTYLPLP